jgi:hypothetical protein
VTYGCHNRKPYKNSLEVQTGWFSEFARGHTRTPNMEFSPFRMERDCQYTKTDLGQADPKCAGCKWRVVAIPGQ